MPPVVGEAWHLDPASGFGCFYAGGSGVNLVLPGTVWSSKRDGSICLVLRVETPTVFLSISGGASVPMPLGDFLDHHSPVRRGHPPASAPRSTPPMPGEEWVYAPAEGSILFFLVASVQGKTGWVVLYPEGNPAHAQTTPLRDFLSDPRWRRYHRLTAYQHLLDN